MNELCWCFHAIFVLEAHSESQAVEMLCWKQIYKVSKSRIWLRKWGRFIYCSVSVWSDIPFTELLSMCWLQWRKCTFGRKESYSLKNRVQVVKWCSHISMLHPNPFYKGISVSKSGRKMEEQVAMKLNVKKWCVFCLFCVVACWRRTYTPPHMHTYTCSDFNSHSHSPKGQ